MATTLRSLDTRFWSDGWVRKLDPIQRYAFLYFLTNQHSTWCGVYELDSEMAAFEMGVSEAELMTDILPSIAPKIIFVDGWVYIKNFEKYHKNGSRDTEEGIKKAWNAVPEKIRAKIDSLSTELSTETLPQGGGVGVSSSPFPSLPNLSPTTQKRGASKEAGNKNTGMRPISEIIKQRTL